MGRFWLGIGLLAALLAVSLGVTYSAQSMHTPVSADLEQAALAALDGRTEDALALARQARQLWDRRWHKTAVFSDHTPMDEIDSLFSQLETYGQAGHATDLAALCTRLSQLVHAIAEGQNPSWWNLLSMTSRSPASP